MRTIGSYQEEVDQWIKEHGVRYFNEMTNALLLVEEVGEFSRLIARKYGEQSFKQKSDEENAKEKLEEEIADVYFVLTCLANQLDINLDKAIDQNFSKKTNRDRLRHKNNDKLK